MNDRQLLRYSRHLLLEEIGIDGQSRLLAGTALIVGAGGLGSPAAMYLAAAGVGRILLADDDHVDLTNLQRQILHREATVGLPKVDSGRATLRALNADVEIVTIHARLDAGALERLARESSVVLDCTDNFATRHAVNRACVAARVPLVSGAALRFDGQVSVFDARRSDCACYNCVFPEDSPVEEALCATMGVFAPLTGIVGSIQAAEALKLIGGFGLPMTGKLLMIQAREMSFETVGLRRDPGCGVCASRAAIPMESNP